MIFLHIQDSRCEEAYKKGLYYAGYKYLHSIGVMTFETALVPKGPDQNLNTHQLLRFSSNFIPPTSDLKQAAQMRKRKSIKQAGSYFCLQV